MVTTNPYPDIEQEFVLSGLTYKFDADVIHTHLIVELLMTRALELHLAHPEEVDLDRLSFTQKASLIFALGVLPLRYKGIIRLLNSRRNDHAHTLAFEITDTVVSEVEQVMKACGIKWANEDMKLCQLSLMTKDVPPARMKFQDLGRLLAVDICRTLTDQYRTSTSVMPTASSPTLQA